MVVSIRNKNFSGQLIKETENDLIILLKPYNTKTFVRIKNGIYSYISDKEVNRLLEIQQ